MTEGPIADPRYVQPKGFIEKLKKLCARNPKGRPIDPETGELLPDPTPIAPPIGYVAEESMFDRVRRMVRQASEELKGTAEVESFEEANDFDVEDDIPEPFSPYEAFMLFKDQPTPDEDDAVEARRGELPAAPVAAGSEAGPQPAQSPTSGGGAGGTPTPQPSK